MRIIILPITIFVVAFLLFSSSVRAEDKPKDELTTQEQADKERGEALLEKIRSRHPRFAVVGPLERGSSTPYAVNGEDFTLDDETRIDGQLILGRGASVSGFIEGDKKVARVITVWNGKALREGEDNSKLDVSE